MAGGVFLNAELFCKSQNRTEVNVAGGREQLGQSRHFYNGKKTFMQLENRIPSFPHILLSYLCH
jgi:hypothetical protein